MTNSSDNGAKAPGLWQVFTSVLASFFGVQSDARRKRDFGHGKPSQYIAIGLFLTILFVVTVWLAVSTVLHLAGV